MKVPNKIKNKMRAAVKLSSAAWEAESEVEKWLESVGIDSEELRDGGGYGMEELENGIDVTDALAERILRYPESRKE